METNELIILFEDNHIIVVLKPQMVACCPDESGDDNLLDCVKRYIKTAYNKPGNAFVGLVHRLDRPTGGVMVFAKTSKAAARLSAQMRDKDFEKRYLTVLCGTLPEKKGSLKNYLRKNSVNNTVYVCTQTEEGAKLAALEYEVKDERDNLTLAEINLLTGRTHQIRVQTAAVNAPVYGDMRYGGEKAQKGKLALWAYSLRFTHPVTGERLRFMAEPPVDGVPWKSFDINLK
ncbi:MAG: RluA family pseudouridine synthase [Clostridia bacterium]|nr:RluA family pseudouridine synthase [Clostridia bacterium]MDE7306522.1 RluA family pseudouridine synthase [Clostridia bacterium]